MGNVQHASENVGPGMPRLGPFDRNNRNLCTTSERTSDVAGVPAYVACRRSASASNLACLHGARLVLHVISLDSWVRSRFLALLF